MYLIGFGQILLKLLDDVLLHISCVKESQEITGRSSQPVTRIMEDAE
jgi:hypothetical protein